MRVSILIGLFSLVLLSIGQDDNLSKGDSWSELKKNTKGKIIVNWYPSSLFITESNGQLEGFEFELFKAFIAHTENKYEVSIDVEWRQAQDFNDILHIVSTAGKGHFGVSSISITPQRKEVLSFTPPYFPDLMVLVSNSEFQLAKTSDDFAQLFKESIAVTIPNTTMEKQLLELNTNLNLDLQFVFVDNTGEIIEKIESIPNSFGYIDLANFITALNEAASVKRQYFYPVRLEGLSFAYSVEGDWSEPVEAYFSSDQFENDRKYFTQKYLGDNVHYLVERISKSAELGPYDEIILLTEEKELQAKELLAAALRDKSRQIMINWLIAGVFLVIIVAAFFYIRFQVKVKANQSLRINQQLIEEHNNQLLVLNQEKNDLIRILAHDLRNPINQLLGFSELLLKNAENLKGDQLAMIGFMKQSSEKLRDMISKILDVDAIEAGDRNVFLEKLEVEPMIKRIERDFTSVAEAKGITLSCLSDTNVYVLADKVYLTQILENLVSNAIKFSNSQTEVKLTVKSNKKEVIFIVADQGPGFTKKDQEKIFKKYQQLSAKSTAGEPSTGLGLSIVKMFAEMMKGSVSFDTEEGVGTTFYIHMPIAI